MTKIAAIVVAAGRGTRVASGSLPKQYMDIAGEMLLTRSLGPLVDHPRIDRVVVVIHRDNRALYGVAVTALGAGRAAKLLPPATVSDRSQRDSPPWQEPRHLISS